MRIRHVKIRNFRSIREIDLDVPDMLVLLGPNNHGKSNILSALEFGLTTAGKPSPADLCAFRDAGERSLWVEMTFAEFTEQERTTFQKYLRSDGTATIRKTTECTEEDDVEVSYRGYVQEPDEWWLKSSAFERLRTLELVRTESQNVPALQPLLDGGRMTRPRLQEFQDNYIRDHHTQLRFSETLEDGPLLGVKNVAGGVLPEFYLVPAVRDLSDETRIRNTTVFGRLLQRAVQEMTARDPRFLDLRDRLQQLIGELNDRPQGEASQRSQLAELEGLLSNELSSWGVNVSIQVTPPEIEKILELGTELHLDDGLRTLAERKGHGLQRAVLFALLRAWAKVLRTATERAAGNAQAPRRASESTYFAIEEPELFLHPHAQRQLHKALRDLATSAQHQVFLCTHSTFFVDLDHYQSIAICRKPDSPTGTRIRQCTRELFQGEDAHDRKNRFHMATWINPDRGELFFAKKVVLVEGETEKVILPFLAATLGCVDSDVSIIDCGSKFNIRLYIAILNAFKIPYCVVHDEDPLPNPVPVDWTPEKTTERRRTFEENAQIAAVMDTGIGCIEIMCPDFESVAGISRTQGDKKGKPIAALDHFTGINAESIPAKLVETVQQAYRAPAAVDNLGQ